MRPQVARAEWEKGEHQFRVQVGSIQSQLFGAARWHRTQAPIRAGSTRPRTRARTASVGRRIKPEPETRKPSRGIPGLGRMAGHRATCPAAGAKTRSTFDEHCTPKDLSWPRKLA